MKLDFSEVQAFIQGELNLGTFPGALLLVHHDGKPVFQFHAGTYQNRERRDNPVAMNTSHMLFSFSKGISATVVAMANQRGLLDYDTPIVRYIPELQNDLGAKVTIRHCLTHSLGIPSQHIGPVDTDDGWRESVDVCSKATLEWEPGSKTHYHASQGLFLAAEAVRRVSGESTWEAVCRKWLFEPLGAHSLTFMVPARKDVALTPQPSDCPSEITNTQFGLLGHPGGGCFGEIGDALKVLELHLAKGQWNGKPLLTAETHQEMHRVQYESQMQLLEADGKWPIHEPWGLGWLIRRTMKGNWFGFGDVASPRSFGHAGIDTVQGVADPDRGVSFLFMSTNSPKPSEANTVRIRDTVATKVIAALDMTA